MRKIVVFDLDDTLWSLNERAAKLAKVDFNKITNFVVDENSLLTSEEKKRLYEVYHSVNLWKNIIWDDKAKDIYKLEQYNAKVFINSNCPNQDIVDYKRSFLSDVLNLPNDQIILNVSTAETKKKMIPNMFIFADDSPYNIQDSTAIHNIIPDKRWNKHINGSNIYRCSTFKDIYYLCEKLLKEELKMTNS